MNSYLSLVLPALAAVVVAFVLAPLTARLAVRVGAIDLPGRRKTHAAPTPRLGGLAVVGAIAAVWAAAFWLFGVSLPRELSIGLVAGGLPILAVSVIDDMRGVSAGRKLLVHITAASLAVAAGVALGDVVHLFDVEIHLGIWALPLSVVWLVGVTNAFNVIDGLDGLSAGLAGVLISSRVGTGQSDSGTDLLFIVIAGIVVGGTSIMGGMGAIWRTALGVLFVAMINNGFTLLGLNPTYEQIVQGALILLAVGLDAWSKKVR